MNPAICFNPPTTMQQVLQYVKDHPRCKRVDIAKSLGLPPNTVSGNLWRLHESGRIRPHKVAGGRKNGVAWEEGTDEGLIPKQQQMHGCEMRQKTVKTWEPHLLRDPLVALLFGQAA